MEKKRYRTGNKRMFNAITDQKIDAISAGLKIAAVGLAIVFGAPVGSAAEAEVSAERLMTCTTEEIIELHSRTPLSPGQFRRWFKAQKPIMLTADGLRRLSSAGLISSKECDEICRMTTESLFQTAISAVHGGKKAVAENALKKLKTFGWAPADFWMVWLKEDGGSPHIFMLPKVQYSKYYSMLDTLIDSRNLADKYTAAYIILKGGKCPVPQCVAGSLFLDLGERDYLDRDHNWRGKDAMNVFASMALYRVSQRDYKKALDGYKQIISFDRQIEAKIRQAQIESGFPFGSMAFTSDVGRTVPKLLVRQNDELRYVVRSAEADDLVMKVQNAYLAEHQKTWGDFCEAEFREGQWVVKKLPRLTVVEFSGIGKDRNLNIIRIRISPDGRFWNIDEWLKTGTVSEPLVHVQADSSPMML